MQPAGINRHSKIYLNYNPTYIIKDLHLTNNFSQKLKRLTDNKLFLEAQRFAYAPPKIICYPVLKNYKQK